MPALSMFYGIIIRMFREAGAQHNTPHFHAVYQGNNATFDFDGNLLEGKMPIKQTKLIVAWAELHRDELIADWELATTEQPLFKIEPLR